MRGWGHGWHAHALRARRLWGMPWEEAQGVEAHKLSCVWPSWPCRLWGGPCTRGHACSCAPRARPRVRAGPTLCRPGCGHARGGQVCVSAEGSRGVSQVAGWQIHGRQVHGRQVNGQQVCRRQVCRRQVRAGAGLLAGSTEAPARTRMHTRTRTYTHLRTHTYAHTRTHRSAGGSTSAKKGPSVHSGDRWGARAAVRACVGAPASRSIPCILPCQHAHARGDTHTHNCACRCAPPATGRAQVQGQGGRWRGRQAGRHQDGPVRVLAV